MKATFASKAVPDLKVIIVARPAFTNSVLSSFLTASLKVIVMVELIATPLVSLAVTKVTVGRVTSTTNQLF